MVSQGKIFCCSHGRTRLDDIPLALMALGVCTLKSPSY